MSLITRCPACGTMFKVVPDQLRISEGWVRCGHCTEVFDASAHLQQASTAGAPVASPLIPDMVESTAFTSTEPGNLDLLEEPAPSYPEPDLDNLLVEGPESASMPAEPIAIAPVPAYMTQAVSAPLVQTAESSPVRLTTRAQAEPVSSFFDSALPGDAMPPDSTLQDVSFVRDARRKAFWRRPLVRLSLSLVALLLLAVLGLQLAVHERDRIAAMEPRALPWLQQLCAQLQCRVGPLRQIESIVIDSSAFNKLRPDAYRLSVTVRNSASVPLAMPALELALTDSADQPVLRRVLLPADLGATPPVLAAGGEWSGSFPLSVSGAGIGGGGRIVGYRLLAFYP